MDVQRESKYPLAHSFAIELKQAAAEWIERLESDHPFESDDQVLGMDSYIKGQIDFLHIFFGLEKKIKG